MNRKTILACLAAMFLMMTGIGVAVAFLYSDSESGARSGVRRISDKGDLAILRAVPSDAALVAVITDAEGITDFALEHPAVVSLHYAGSMIPLYVFDAGEASAEPSAYALSLMERAAAEGRCAEYVDCSSLEGVSGRIAEHSLVLVSGTEALVKSSLRHLAKSLSVLDAKGFDKASGAVTSGNRVYVSNAHSGRLVKELVAKKFNPYPSFFESFADWTVFEASLSSPKGPYFRGTAVYDEDESEYLTVLSTMTPAVPGFADMLPSYTLFAASLPVSDDMEAYMEAYKAYLDSDQKLSMWSDSHRKLKGSTGLSPDDYCKVFDIEEAATAVFMTGSRLEKVNLVKVGNNARKAVIGEDVKERDYVPEVQNFRYGSYMSQLFGGLFAMDAETCFTYVDGWMISGSRPAVEEFVSGRAMEYTLSEYMKDSSQGALLSSPASFTAYFSVTEASDMLDGIFAMGVAERIRGEYSSYDYCPAVLSVKAGGKSPEIRLGICPASMERTKAPAFERDTTVVIPQGPFSVRNSGTGRMNRFYQNSHMSLCLAEEDGKGIWGVPFHSPICGCASTVDYYANAKLQILFASGTKIYLIDRLGRFVSGFPVDLGKEILLGPSVYDFSGARKYNIMVLHKDNTIEMYNLKGQKPASWKTIRTEETIKGLPERIVVGGNTFWVVRTSIRTLIYPFYGGEPLTLSEGDRMIRPDSEISVADATSVMARCYDGKERAVRLK